MLGKKNSKKQIKQSKKQTKRNQDGRPVKVSFILDKDGTVTVSSTVPSLALLRGMTEEGLDVLKGANEVQYNRKESVLSRRNAEAKQAKQRADAKKWNAKEKAKLNKNVKKDKK